MVFKHSPLLVLVFLLLAVAAFAAIGPSCADEYDQCKSEKCPVACTPGLAMTPECTTCADTNCKTDYDECQKADEPAPVVLSCHDEYDKCEETQCPTQCNKDHEEMTPECTTCLETHCKAKYDTCLEKADKSAHDSLIDPPVEPSCLDIYDTCGEIHCPTLCNDEGKTTPACKTCADPRCKADYDHCQGMLTEAVTATNATSLNPPVKLSCADEYGQCKGHNCATCTSDGPESAECTRCADALCKEGRLECENISKGIVPGMNGGKIAADDTPPVLSACDTEYMQCETEKCPTECLPDAAMTPDCQTCIDKNCIVKHRDCLRALRKSAPKRKLETLKKKVQTRN